MAGRVRAAAEQQLGRRRAVMVPTVLLPEGVEMACVLVRAL